jgi:hypothetical protein
MVYSEIAMNTLTTIVYAGYRQFYLRDAVATADTTTSEFWSQEAHTAMLAVAPGILGIGTSSYGDVKVTINVVETDPLLKLANWDHVAEASLTVASSTIALCPCPAATITATMTVQPSMYRVRIYATNLDFTVEEGEDYYRFYRE